MSSASGAVRYSVSGVKDKIHVTSRRVVATVIDAIVLGAAYSFLVATFGRVGNPRPWEWHGTLDNIPANVLYGLGVVLYFVLMEGYLGQTLGKMVTGIAVVREDGSGVPGLASALIRTVLRIVDGLLGYAVAFILVLASDKRQRLGDVAAHTLVIRKQVSGMR